MESCTSPSLRRTSSLSSLVGATARSEQQRPRCPAAGSDSEDSSAASRTRRKRNRDVDSPARPWRLPAAPSSSGKLRAATEMGTPVLLSKRLRRSSSFDGSFSGRDSPVPPAGSSYASMILPGIQSAPSTAGLGSFTMYGHGDGPQAWKSRDSRMDLGCDPPAPATGSHVMPWSEDECSLFACTSSDLGLGASSSRREKRSRRAEEGPLAASPVHVGGADMEHQDEGRQRRRRCLRRRLDSTASSTSSSSSASNLSNSSESWSNATATDASFYSPVLAFSSSPILTIEDDSSTPPTSDGSVEALKWKSPWGGDATPSSPSCWSPSDALNPFSLGSSTTAPLPIANAVGEEHSLPRAPCTSPTSPSSHLEEAAAARMEALHARAFDDLRKCTERDEQGFVARMRAWEQKKSAAAEDVGWDHDEEDVRMLLPPEAYAVESTPESEEEDDEDDEEEEISIVLAGEEDETVRHPAARISSSSRSDTADLLGSLQYACLSDYEGAASYTCA